MKQHSHLSLWMVMLAGCSAAATLACGDDAGSADNNGAGNNSGAATTAGMSAGGTSGSVGAAGAATGGSGTSTAGSSNMTAGAGGTSGSTSGGSGGISGGAMNGGMAGTGGGMAGTGGGMAGTGGSTDMPYGIVSCQPAFETACKPDIVFENQDPDGKGKVFTNVVPDVTAAMQNIACTACSILYRSPDEIPKNKHPSTVKLILDTHGGVAQAGGGQIQFDLNYINGYKDRSAAETKQEMLGVLQHETVHLYQNYGTTGTGEGLADLVRARTGYYPPSRWRSEGDWKTPYTASGNFYSWLTGPCTFHSKAYSKHDFDLPYKINKVLAGKNGDDESFSAVAGLLQTTFGKSVDDLWAEYQKDAYGK